MIKANALADKGRAENEPAQFDRAVQLLRRALEDHKGGNQQLYVALGQILQARGMLDSAAEEEIEIP